MLRRTHSYLFLRMSVNPLTIGALGVLFGIIVVHGYQTGGISTDNLTATGVVLGFIAALIGVYLKLYRGRNAVRIEVSPEGLVYRDRGRRLEVSKADIVALDELGGSIIPRFRVRTKRGDFEFDGQLVSAWHLRRVIEGWLGSEG